MDIKHASSTASLSPFELKDELITLAGSVTNRLMLNAGRGNPNFVATVPRHGFWQLGLFAMTESERSFSYLAEGVGGFPRREGIEERFDLFTRSHHEVPGVKFLSGAVSFVRDQLGLDGGDFIYEMCQGILACSYPVPDRMLRLSEKIVKQYIRREMIGGHPFAGDFDLYAVEGGTAAMTYLFNSMKINHLLQAGDVIALGKPIFTPYIEIPELAEFGLAELSIDADPANGWQYSKAELDKLRDPKVKAFFLVNPSNPPSVKVSDESLRYLADIVKDRPDLIILTDDVYGTFADNFVSLFALCPRNTLLVYSYSKYFGATGWRLGVIAAHKSNLFDEKIAQLGKAEKDGLNARYASITTAPEKLLFIDRIVADSRTVALNHTAGLSTPQQVQMVLFSLFSLMDTADHYKAAMKRLIRGRKAALYRGMGAAPDAVDENVVDYYTLLDVEQMSREVGPEFVKWLLANIKPHELLFRLAEEAGVVLLPGKGFGTVHPSGRVSLANLNEQDYVKIGQCVRNLRDEYLERYRALGSKGGKGSKGAKDNGKAPDATTTTKAI